MAAQDRGARTDGEPVDASPTSFEYRSRLKVMGLPLIHLVRGIDPSSGRRPTAVGIVAIGQVAIGLVAIGQVAIGVISLGQASIALGWGIGQLAFGLLAAGQVGAGLIGSVGQIAAGPNALGMATDPGMWVAAGWLIGGVLMWSSMRRRRRRLAPLIDASPVEIASVRDGRSHVTGEVLSNDRLSAPLSSRPCVFWHTVHVGAAVRAHERSGGEVTIADESGRARVDFDSEVLFIRSDKYREIAGPDWALHLETSLAQGETLHVAGPVSLTPDASAGGPYRGGIAPVFSGKPGQPVIVTTRSPIAMRTELRFAAALAWALLAAGTLAVALWPVAT
jgi:hypothetical protein